MSIVEQGCLVLHIPFDLQVEETVYISEYSFMFILLLLFLQYAVFCLDGYIMMVDFFLSFLWAKWPLRRLEIRNDHQWVQAQERTDPKCSVKWHYPIIKTKMAIKISCCLNFACKDLITILQEATTLAWKENQFDLMKSLQMHLDECYNC